ncbi:MAG: oligosaccharide flippase family protein [Candidatus Helarchaeota archaeon]
MSKNITKNSDINKQIQRNFWFYTIDQIFMLLFSFGINLLIINLVPYDNYGKYALIMAGVNLISIFSTFGIPRALLRQIPGLEDNKKIKDYFFTSLIIILINSILIALLFNFIFQNLYKNISNIIIGLNFQTILIILNSLNTFTYYFIIALKRMDFSFFGNILKYFIWASYIFLFLFIINFYDYVILLFGFFIGTLIGSVFELLYLLFYIKKQNYKLKYNYNFNIFKNTLKKLIYPSISGLTSSVCGIFIFTYGVLFLGYFTNLYDISLFDVSSSISYGIFVVSTSIMGALFPYLVNYFHKDNNEFKKTTLSALRIFISITLFIVIIGNIFSEQILSILTSNKYTNVALIFKLQLISILFFGINSQILSIFFITKKFRIFITGNLSIMGLYFCISLFYVSFLESTLGVVLGLLMSNIILFIVLTFLFKYKLNLLLLNKKMLLEITIILVPILLFYFINFLLNMIYPIVYFNYLIYFILFISFILMVFYLYKLDNKLMKLLLFNRITFKKKVIKKMNKNSDIIKIKEKIKHYDSIKEISKYDEDRFNNIYGFLLNNLQKLYIRNFYSQVDNNIIIDLATGTGRFLIPHSMNFKNAIGIDAALNMLRFLKKKLIKYNCNNVELINADIDHLPIKPNKIDFISAIHVFLHIEKYPNAFKEIYKILNPNGIFIFDVSNADYIIRKLLNFVLKNRTNYYYTTKYSLIDIKSHYRKLGIKIRKYYIRKIGIFIIYLFPNNIRKLFQKFFMKKFLKLLLFNLEKILSNSFFIFQYFSPDLLIIIKK